PGPGGRFDAPQIDEALKALYATGLFQDVRINPVGGRIVVTVVEAPVVNRVQFEGNKRVKDEQLVTEVQSKPRGTLSRATVQADVQRIIEVYHHVGRFDIHVEPKIIELPNNRVDLIYEITEGERTTVRKIRFVGNRSFSDVRLKDIIRTTETSLLSFLKSSDIYDADRIEADRDLLRRFYLTKGFADVRIVAAAAEFDPSIKGFAITFTIDEGDQYHFGNVDVQSSVPDIDPNNLRAKLKVFPGSIYNAEAIEKSVEDMTIEMSRRGYPFAQIRPRGDRDDANRRIGVVFVVEQGSRGYIERINVRGNTKTRDYVIRREFDIAEGDAYNKVLVDRAERRLKNLNYFKTVKITTEPGSAPDRVILNVDVEEQATGEFSVSGGYSTADGFLAEVSLGERNLLGKGQYLKGSVTYGQYARGAQISFVEPYFLNYRLSLGLDIFAKETISSSFQSYGSDTDGVGLTLGFPLREDLSLQLRYSLYQQKITLDPAINLCSATFPAPACLNTGILQASVALQQEASLGEQLVSQVGYAITFNTLDNNKNPHGGLIITARQDLAGVGGDVDFIKSTIDARYYQEILTDVTAMLRGQAGYVTAWGGQQLPIIDNFFGGPSMVRGFQVNGFGPRDLTPGTTMDAVGGTRYWAGTLEFQAPIPNLPKDIGLKAAVFSDAGSLYDYNNQIVFPQFGRSILLADSALIRSSVGVGLIWESPFGPLRFDYAIPITKEPYDVIQEFRFSGGTKF
ncbi:MAG TPA: outer membrane protein assembly factor BamA, partial [Xanthobacteraceae bacterium]|nr:outer membrane protein assembly factor BamA [Xanthobacteraceae bacterium]